MVFDAANGSSTFVIPNFSGAQSLAVGQFLCSRAFPAGGHEWVFYFFPRGRVPADGDYSSAYFALQSEASDVRALFMLRLEDQSGNGNHLIFTHFDHSLVHGPITLMRGYMWYAFDRIRLLILRVGSRSMLSSRSLLPCFLRFRAVAGDGIGS